VIFDVGGDNHTCKVANSILQFLHLKLRNRSVCFLCVSVFRRRIGRLSNGNRSVWVCCISNRSRNYKAMA
jgi:hypothetical protein